MIPASRESRFRFTMVKQGPKAPQLDGYSFTIDLLRYDYQWNVHTRNWVSQATGAHPFFGPLWASLGLPGPRLCIESVGIQGASAALNPSRRDLGWLLAPSGAGGTRRAPTGTNKTVRTHTTTHPSSTAALAFNPQSWCGQRTGPRRRGLLGLLPRRSPKP